MAGWQSGYAAACKAVYAGSIPASASINQKILRLKIHAHFIRKLNESCDSGRRTWH